jgi:hypothetical protein
MCAVVEANEQWFVNVSFAPESGRQSDIAPCPICANNGHWKPRHSGDRHCTITSPALRGFSGRSEKSFVNAERSSGFAFAAITLAAGFAIPGFLWWRCRSRK